MRVSEYYRLDRTQPSLDFVDVDIAGDTRVYVDPRSVLSESEWGQECVSLLQNFFDTVLQAIRSGNHTRAHQLLASLTEPKETHLGLSKSRSRGRGMGADLARNVWKSLSHSQAVQSGLVADLEDTALFVDGVGFDIISDITTNIIRGQLIQFTQETATFYQIPLTPGVVSGQIWDRQRRQWHQGYVTLPVTHYGPLLLVPKSIVRRNQTFDPGEYYRHYVLPQLQAEEEARASSSLVDALRKGQPTVTRRSIIEKYGQGKHVNLETTIRNPAILEQYRKNKSQRSELPGHDEIAELTSSETPDWDKLLNSVKAIPPGFDSAADYHLAMEALLTALFYPALDRPKREFPLHEGRKRIDITYTNTAVRGFFEWVNRVKMAPAPYLFVECKNYGRDLGNPEVDQLAGRFSEQRGRVGLLIHRGFGDKDLLIKRCRDTAMDNRGFILALDDADLEGLVNERKAKPSSIEFDLLNRRFQDLV